MKTKKTVKKLAVKVVKPFTIRKPKVKRNANSN